MIRLASSNLNGRLWIALWAVVAASVPAHGQTIGASDDPSPGTASFQHLSPEHREEFLAIRDNLLSRRPTDERSTNETIRSLTAAVLSGDGDAVGRIISEDDFGLSVARHPDVVAALLVIESPYVIDIGEALDPEARAGWFVGMLRMSASAVLAKWSTFSAIYEHLFADDGTSSLPRDLHETTKETLVRCVAQMPADVYAALPRRGVIARAVTPLGETAHSNLYQNPATLAMVLKDHPAGASVVSEFGAAIHRAAFQNRDEATECVRLLLESGADPNLRDRNGMTALMWAAVGGTQESLEMLLDAGARVSDQSWDSIVGDDRWSALHFAASRGMPDVAVKKIEAMLRVDNCIDIRDFDGNTPLHIAYRYGATEVVEALIRLGANESVRNRDGQIPADLIQMRSPNR
jgi:hypothetical protein